MILFDTSVILDALDKNSEQFEWASRLIIEAAAEDGAAVNAVTVAELCAGDRDPESVEADLLNWDLQVLDIPAVAAAICGKAHRRYAIARSASGGGLAPKIPLPDFFIGAHAEIMKWKLATRDADRISRYFPKVHLLTPKKIISRA
jgi:predicted nucleic acid-binding protein